MNLLKVISMKAKLFSTVVFMMIMLSILSYLNTVEEIKIYQDGKVTQLKSIVDFSYSRLEDLYKKMNDRGLSEEYIRKLYYSEMTAMQYDNGNGYVFLISKDGTMLLNPNKPSLNGINQINLKDSNGVLWVKEVIDVSMDKNRDLAEYTLRKPSNNKTTKKMTYAKYYAPLDIVVASGSYMDDIEKVERDLITLVIEELLILGLIVLITSFIVIKDFNKSMAKLKDDMIELSHGNTSIKIDLSRGDEIGKMAECLDVFKTNTIAMNKAKDQELEKAKEDTKSKDRVQELVGNIAQESLVVEDHISGISIAASELSSTLEDITNKVNETSTMTDLAQNEAEKGQSTISDLSNSAVKIGEVVDLIKDIAEKTNLLALNASIEAARAGEEGRGFAVVAEEVKKLAQQTSDATNDISNLVKTIQKNSGNSVDSIGQISEQISSINDVTKQLVISMAEQRSATNDISERMVQASEGSKEVSEKIKEIND